jgi:hypothetical protein
MVGMQMRIDCLDELEVELANKLQITIDALDDGIDNQRLATVPAGEHIGVCAGRAVEELAKNHRRLLHFRRALYTGCGFAGIEASVWPPLSGQATFRFEHALARGRKFRKLRRRPDRPPQQLAAAIRAAALQNAFGARAAEGAFERANHRVTRIRRQIDVAAFAARLQQKHFSLPIVDDRFVPREPIVKRVRAHVPARLNTIVSDCIDWRSN